MAYSDQDELENRLRDVACGDGHPRMKGRIFECLLTRMFDEAVAELEKGAEQAQLRGEMLLEFAERRDLCAAFLREGVDEKFCAELMNQVAERLPEVEDLLEPVITRRPDYF